MGIIGNWRCRRFVFTFLDLETVFRPEPSAWSLFSRLELKNMWPDFFHWRLESWLPICLKLWRTLCFLHATQDGVKIPKVPKVMIIFDTQYHFVAKLPTLFTPPRLQSSWKQLPTCKRVFRAQKTASFFRLHCNSDSWILLHRFVLTKNIYFYFYQLLYRSHFNGWETCDTQISILLCPLSSSGWHNRELQLWKNQKANILLSRIIRWNLPFGESFLHHVSALLISHKKIKSHLKSQVTIPVKFMWNFTWVLMRQFFWCCRMMTFISHNFVEFNGTWEKYSFVILDLVFHTTMYQPLMLIIFSSVYLGTNFLAFR